MINMNVENMFDRLENTLQAGEVVRYHTTPRVRSQNVAAHSWGVAVIAMALTQNVNDADKIKRLLFDALTHDVAELFTGDIPTPAKRKCADIYKLENDLERFFLLKKDFFCSPDNSFVLAGVLFFADKLEALRWTYLDDSADAAALNESFYQEIKIYLKNSDVCRKQISDSILSRVIDLAEKWHKTK